MLKEWVTEVEEAHLKVILSYIICSFKAKQSKALFVVLLENKRKNKYIRASPPACALGRILPAIAPKTANSA